ncbi:MAG TPA: tetratricopeptide repeat protein [Nitrospiria bacterium]|nr:tetratricopeptide repeat protein [Nitrospiria bacterium]
MNVIGKIVRSHARRMGILAILIALSLSGCSTTSSVQKEKNAQAHYKLGLSYLNDNQTQMAFVEFQKSIEANPKDRDSHYGLGHIYFTQGKFEQARDEFQKAIQIDPKYSEAHNYLGTVYERLGDQKKAIEEYRKALANPQYFTPQYPHRNLAMVYLNMNEYKSAIKEFKEALSLPPPPDDPLFNALVFNGLGQAYYKDGQFPEAVDAFNSALKIAPDYTEVHYFLGQAYYKTGSGPLAKEEFQRVIHLAPDSDLAKKAKQSLELLR